MVSSMTTCCMRIAIRSVSSTSMLVGPDTAARLLEVGIAEAEGIEFIVHAMPARAKFLES